MIAADPSEALPRSPAILSSLRAKPLGHPNTVLVAGLLAMANAGGLWHATFAGRLFTLAFLALVPGAVLLSLTQRRPSEASVRVAWSIGASLLILMLAGLLLSYALPPLGITPLRTGPMLVAVDIVVVVAVLATRRRDPLGFLLDGLQTSYQDVAAVAIACLLPVLAAAGAERLNNGDGGELSMATMGIVGVLVAALFVLAERLRARTISLGLYAATAAALLLTSMRATHPYGYDIQTEYQVFTSTLHRGAWHVPPHGNAYAAMLSITVLPSILSTVSGVSPIYLFKLFYPLVFSMFPVLVYVAASRMFPRRASLVGPIIVVVQGLFSADMTGLARQEIGLLYFGLFVVSAFDTSLDRRWRQVGAGVAMTGMAITHYSSAYFATIVVVGGYLVYLVVRFLWRGVRSRAVVSAPLVAFTVAVVTIWNVVITHSATNIANVASSLASSGLALLPGAGGSSLVQRFLNADVTPTVRAGKFASIAKSYYRTHAPYLHTYPAALTSHYPVRAATVPGSSSPSGINAIVGNAGTICSELVLVITAVGVLVLLWRARRDREGGEIAAFALACLGLLALLRLSGTLSSLYNAPRGLVQGAPLLSLGIALVCTWLFNRRAALKATLQGATLAGLALLLFTSSGLSDVAFTGAADTFSNRGEAYQRYWSTDADHVTAGWVVHHQQRGQVVYADVYAALQLFEYAHLRGLVTTVIPQVLEPGAYVVASSTNLVNGTARSLVRGDFAIYRFPRAFLDRTKDVVLTTGTTEVFR